MDGKSTGNKAVTRQSQAYPKELGRAIVSAWLTTRLNQESSGYLAGLQGHASLKANGPEFDTSWEGREVASIGPVIPDRGMISTPVCCLLFLCVGGGGSSNNSTYQTPNWEGWD